MTFSNRAKIQGMVQVASDGSYRDLTGRVGNDSAWGGHQSRITRHNGNVLRMSYVSYVGTQNYWTVMKSVDDGATWLREAYRATDDDHHLLRDVRDDSAYIVGYDKSTYLAKIYSSRDNFASATSFPGTWPNVPDNGTHYSAASISPVDGTIILNEANDDNVDALLYTTDSCMHDSMVAQYVTNATTWSDNTTTKGSWKFSGLVRTYIGLRNNYTYLFPKPLPSLMDRVYGLGTGNLLYSAAGYNALSSYVWPFHQYWSNDISNWQDDNQNTNVLGYNSCLNDRIYVNKGIYDPGKATASSTPFFKPDDAYIDTKGRMFVTSYCEADGSGTRANGYWMTIYDCATNQVIDDFLMSDILPYGNTRIIENSNGNMFIFWINAGSGTPYKAQVRLYRLIENRNKATPWLPSKWTIQTPYADLSSSLGNYVPEIRSVRIASPKGGSPLQQNFVDILIQCTDNQYSGSPVAYPSPAYGSGGMRTFYAKLVFPYT